MKWIVGLGTLALIAIGCGGSGDGMDSRMGNGTGMMRNVSPTDVDRATRSLSKGKSAQVPVASNEFGFKLLEQLTKKSPSSNIFISPASISSALAMTYNGAAGSTRDAMGKTLGVEGISLQELNDGEKQLLTLLSAPDAKVQLQIANSLWAKAGVEFKREYLGQIEDSYAAKPTVLDFTNPDSPKTINAWVEQATLGKIKEVVKQIDPQSVMFLINAVYFKGSWQDAFDPAQTADRDFTPFDGKKRQTPMMSRRADFPFYQGDKFMAVRLPFGAGRINMTVFLPSQGTELKDVLKRLNQKNWSDWSDKFKPQKGTVVFPKFVANYSAGLNETLKDMGMGIAFTDNADFTAMRTERDLFLRDVLHQTTIEVNEEGAEAAAATKVEVAARSVNVNAKEISFVADHPFAYAISDRETGLILFIGVMGDPSWSGSAKTDANPPKDEKKPPKDGAKPPQ